MQTEISNIMKFEHEDICRICGAASRFHFCSRILGHDVDYYNCPTCGYLQTENPHWLNQAYEKPINLSDTGILSRNEINVGRVIATLVAIGKLHGTVIDNAGGYGILVRLLRDAGIDARWKDKYCQNLVAVGFEANSHAFDLLTAFEVFEHFVHPLAELKIMLEQAPVVLLSTELILTDDVPAPDWWYFGQDHGQHIGFFRSRTLVAMAKEIGCHVATDGRSTHLFSKAPIPPLWRALLALSQYWRILARFTLRSKMMSDSELMRRAGENVTD